MLLNFKKHVSKAIGMSWDDAKAKGTMTWMEALEKTKAALQKIRLKYNI